MSTESHGLIRGILRGVGVAVEGSRSAWTTHLTRPIHYKMQIGKGLGEVKWLENGVVVSLDSMSFEDIFNVKGQF